MPKEIVHGDASCLPPASDSPLNYEEWSQDNPPVVVLRWDREEGHVSIVTRLKLAEVPPSPAPAPMNMESSVAGPSVTVTGNASGALDPRDDFVKAQYGLPVDLDRRGINDLIRKLRRARDAAFGRDE